MCGVSVCLYVPTMYVVCVPMCVRVCLCIYLLRGVCAAIGRACGVLLPEGCCNGLTYLCGINI